MISGNIRKLIIAVNTDGELIYQLPIGDKKINLNDYLNKNLQMDFSGEINCIHCNRKIPKTFNQGYCFPCARRLAACDICIVRPERCHFDQGTCREPDWAQQHCMIEHIVYLANTSGLKIGITRHNQIPTRWLDQGAVQAMPIFRVKNRHIAGLVEVAIQAQVTDKTNWRAMLKEVPLLNLKAEFDDLYTRIQDPVAQIMQSTGSDHIQKITSAEVHQFHYPVIQYPEKIKSFNFDKTPSIHSKLVGLKGQYLIFETGVINMRKYSGYFLNIL